MLSKPLSLTALAAGASAVSFSVSSSNGNATSPWQYGLMFEDINNSGDGGVYAELIQKRAFQGDEIYPKNLTYWNVLGGAELSLQDLENPLSDALPTSMQVTTGDSSEDTIGFSNEGFWGFPVVEGWQYNGSFYVTGGLTGNVTVFLVSNEDEVFVETAVEVSSSDEWMKYEYTFTPDRSAPNSNNTLNFTFAAADLDSPVNFNLLSLFPPTYNDRPNGLRVDLMEAMERLNPSFFRMPGGNNLEGFHPPHFYNWTDTIGPLEERPGFPGYWAYEQTNGLGIIEYLLWAEDLGMEPVLAVFAGLWLEDQVVPEAEIQPYVQSALDELEFLTGDALTTWGARREALGYGPFTINYVQIGNEDSLNYGTDSYIAYRFDVFYQAIKEAYPHITLVASFYDENWIPSQAATWVDFHQYAIPVQMSSEFDYFDNDTTTVDHPILIGEYAVVAYDQPGLRYRTNTTTRSEFPFWYGSVAEAVFLLGAERNAHKIVGSAYAPTFQNLNRWEWQPDMIQFDAYPGHLTFSTSYYVFEILSRTRITENLPMDIADGGFGPAYFVAGRNDETGSHIAKFVVYNSSAAVPFTVDFDAVNAGAMGNLTYITAPMNASNTVGNDVVEHYTNVIQADDDGAFSFDLPEYSVAVLEVSASAAGQGCDYSHAEGRPGWKGWKHWRQKEHHPHWSSPPS